MNYFILFKELIFLVIRAIGLFRGTPKEKRAEFTKELQLVFNSEAFKEGDTSELENVVNKKL